MERFSIWEVVTYQLPDSLLITKLLTLGVPYVMPAKTTSTQTAFSNSSTLTYTSPKEYKYVKRGFDIGDNKTALVWWDPVMLTFAGTIEKYGVIIKTTNMVEEVYDPITLQQRLGYCIPEDIFEKLLDDFDASVLPDEAHHFILRMVRS
jgi:hypothetical protein